MCTMLKRRKEHLIGARLKEIVPTHLQENYELHWRAFFEGGEAHFIERKQFALMLDSSGFVVPMELVVKFYNEGEYSECFLGMARLVQGLYPFPGDYER